MATTTITKAQKTTQDFVPIQEMRDGVIILKSGQLCMLMLASSINFALKSEDEQIAIITQYQNFLNSIDFDIQIFVQSRKLDIKPYLKTLEDRLKEQTNDLIKTQTREYIEFIKSFNEATNIMSKSFFVVVPYSPSAFQQDQPGLLKKFWKRKKTVEQGNVNFQDNKIQLEQRASVVAQGLDRFGVRTVLLGTEELVELFFKQFNPGESSIPTVGPTQ